MSAKIFLFFCLVLASGDAVSHQSKPGCQKKCGDIIIPYPFGIGSDCSIDKWAEVKCDTSFNPSKLFFTYSIPYEVVEFIPNEVVEFIPNRMFIGVKNNITTICSGVVTSRYDSFLALENSPFIVSDVYNKFVVNGCFMYGEIAGDVTAGCTTDCHKIRECSLRLQEIRECSLGLQQVVVGPYSIHVEALNGSDSGCGSAYLTDETSNSETLFAVTNTVIKDSNHSTVTLEYGIGNQTCSDAKKEPHSFACKHSECFDLHTGYYCHCRSGYQGNPFLPHGCRKDNTCGHVVRGRRVRCPDQPFPFKWIFISFGLGLLILGSVVYYIKRKQLLQLGEKLLKLRERLSLLQEISSRAKVFTSKKLEEATNNFHESRVLGQGGFGTVYKGILPDQSFVAVKKMKHTEKRQFDTFINEVAILIKIEH